MLRGFSITTGKGTEVQRRRSQVRFLSFVKVDEVGEGARIRLSSFHER